MYAAVLFDLFGTLVDEMGSAAPGSHVILRTLPMGAWAIVTSCGEHLARGLLAHAGLPVPAVLVTADDVTADKPAPDGYLLAAQRLDAEPEQCLVVEDSAAGIEAACAAGMDVVAILRGRSDAFARRASFTVGNLGELRLHADAATLTFDP